MSDGIICTWPSCDHSAKGQCRGGQTRIKIYTEAQLQAAIARAERAEAALAVAEEALLEAEGSFESIFACSPARGPSAVAENARNRVKAFLTKIATLKDQR